MQMHEGISGYRVTAVARERAARKRSSRSILKGGQRSLRTGRPGGQR